MAKSTITVSSDDPVDGIVLTSPVHGASFKPNSLLTLKAGQVDPVTRAIGPVPAGTAIAFVVNGTVFGPVVAAPYQFTVRLSPGEKVMEARRVSPQPPPPDPDPVPVDCVLSAWRMASAGPWGACQPSNTQTRTEIWVRDIVTPPANGGAACGPTSETRTGTQACVYVPPPPPPPPDTGSNAYFDWLVSRSDFWKGYSLRPKTGAPITSPYYEKQFARPNQGGYQNSNSAPLGVTYDAAMGAAKVVIPAFTAVGTLGVALTATDTRLFTVGYPTQLVPEAQLRIDGEILIITTRDPSTTVPRGFTVRRGQLGTSPAPHAAGAPIECSTNSVTCQMRFPLGTEDGHTYLFTWDVRFDASCMGTGLSGNKTFQFSSGGDAIWHEIKTLWNGGDGGVRPAWFDPTRHVASVHVRSYGRVGGDSNWSLTDGNTLGPGVTKEDPLQPMANTFAISPNRWTRYWVRIEQRASDYDYFDMWMADEIQAPVQLYTRVPISVRPADFVIQKFWIEFNNSEQRLPAGRLDDLADMVIHVKNIAAVRDPGDVLALLVRPEAG